jgi:glutathione S-transferase
MKPPLLIIGNKNYSSWSLRAWLTMRKAGVEFDERLLPLDTETFAAQIGELSPSRTVPALWDDSSCIWGSLAIAEYANERWAGAELWPADIAIRAQARAISAEMLAGFPALRAQLPMNCRASGRRVSMDNRLAADIARIVAIWLECRDQAGDAGPWLFGKFSIADAMYAPVALRFITYDIEVPAIAARYIDTVLQDVDIASWLAAGREETAVVEADEAGV